MSGSAKIDATKAPPSPITDPLEREVVAVFDGLLPIIRRNPAAARKVAFAALGHAIAFADTFGVDAESFLRELRAKFLKVEPLVFVGKPSGDA